MWFKKKKYISGYNSDTAYDGTDWRTNVIGNSYWSPSQTLPSAADANKYFYLPTLGVYFLGGLTLMGSYGYYWTSSARPDASDGAYSLVFGDYFGMGTSMNIGSGGRNNGYIVGKFE